MQIHSGEKKKETIKTISIKRSKLSPEARLLVDAFIVLIEISIGITLNHFSDKLFKFIVLIPWIAAIYSLFRILLSLYSLVIYMDRTATIQEL